MKKYTVEIEISDEQESMLEQIIKLDLENLEKLGIDVERYTTNADLLEMIIGNSTTILLKEKISQLEERALSFERLAAHKKGCS